MKNTSILDKIQFTKRTNELASCVSLYAQMQSSQKIQNLLSNRLRIESGVTVSRTVPSLFVRGQNFLKNVVNLEIRERVFNAGFTLAEVLITLGIIGIVAAMTIPNLIQKNFERQVVTKLKETQSILAQALKLSQEEYGEVEGWDLKAWSSDSALLIANNLKPFLKIATDCGLVDTDKKCIQSEYLLLNGQKHNKIYLNDKTYYKISLLNGSSIWWRSTDGNGKTLMMFFIDINGKQQPNTVGKDLFLFSYENGAILPNGSPNSSDPAKVSCKDKQSTGFGCAYYVLTKGNMNYLH